jgi:hypothetical protein
MKQQYQGDDYIPTDLSQCDIWEQEALAMDTALLPEWPIDMIADLLMKSAQATEKSDNLKTRRMV